jgi:hypothetical protein
MNHASTTHVNDADYHLVNILLELRFASVGSHSFCGLELEGVRAADIHWRICWRLIMSPTQPGMTLRGESE